MALSNSSNVGLRTTNGDFPVLDMNDRNAPDRIMTHRIVVYGSGTVGGTLTLYRGARVLIAGTETVVFDTTAAAIITVSGSTTVADSVSFQVTGTELWKGVLSGVSGSIAGVLWNISYSGRQ